MLAIHAHANSTMDAKFHVHPLHVRVDRARSYPKRRGHFPSALFGHDAAQGQGRPNTCGRTLRLPQSRRSDRRHEQNRTDKVHVLDARSIVRRALT